MNDKTKSNITKNKKNFNKMKNKFNKSVKVVKLTNVPVNYYSNYYSNTKLIPKTNILNYMFLGFNDYVLYKKKCDEKQIHTLNLDDCFIIDKDSMPTGMRKNEINLTLKMNPKTPLNKLLAYSFYIKQPFIFQNSMNDFLELLKFQIGKDISRDDRNINGKPNPGELYSNIESKYKITDLFYKNIINQLYQINKKSVNLDIVNKFGLISCQNMFGLITDLITIKLNNILKPETNSVFRPKKFNNIIIKKTEISIEMNFVSQLIISKDGEPIDPEYPCGKLDFTLFIDLIKNTYELTKFILSYDINKCGPEDSNITNQSNSINEKNDETKKNDSKIKYIIPATAVTAGLVTLPFILPILGGKTKNKRNKKNKTKRRRKKI